MNKMEDIKLLINIRRQLREMAYKTNNKLLKIDLLRCMQDIRFTIDNYFEGDRDMNKIRRKRLSEAKKLLEQASNIIDDIMNEEDFAFNNLSEGLQQTLRGEEMENNVNEMDEAIENISNAIENIENVN